MASFGKFNSVSEVTGVGSVVSKIMEYTPEVFYSVQISNETDGIIFKQSFRKLEDAINLYCQLDASLNHEKCNLVLIH